LLPNSLTNAKASSILISLSIPLIRFIPVEIRRGGTDNHWTGRTKLITFVYGADFFGCGIV
jgi:hypothetical protein